MRREQTEEQDKELEVFVPENRLYRNKHPLQKMSTVLAGPVMNAIFALLIFIGSLWIQGVNVQPGTTVLGVDEGSPAEAAGFMPGDIVKAIDDEFIDGGWIHMTEIIRANPDREMVVDFLLYLFSGIVRQKTAQKNRRIPHCHQTFLHN